MQQLAHSPSQQGWPSHGLMSVWDMIRLQLEHYVTIGENIATLQRLLDQPGAMVATRGQALTVPESVLAVMSQLRHACVALDLQTSTAVIDRTMARFRGPDQILVLIDLVKQEMSGRLFLHIPAERARFWETSSLLKDDTRAAFPSAALEIQAAGTAYACGLWNASVFHAMRAAESALSVISDELGIQRNGAEQWGNLIDSIEKKLSEITKMPKASAEKRENLQPLSELVIDLRLFKDAWRNQSMHNVVSYGDGNAHAIFHAVGRVLDALAARGGVAASSNKRVAA